jgi:hypothetical protein
MRLYACAMCSQIWEYLTDQDSRDALVVAERFADAEVSEHDLETTRDRVTASTERYLSLVVDCCVSDANLFMALRDAVNVRTTRISLENKITLLREIFGNPFHRATLCGGNHLQECEVCQSLLTRNDHGVQRMAQAIYQEQAFERLPIVADMLEEAGCSNEDMLNHFRGWDRPCPKCQAKEPFPRADCNSDGMLLPMHVRGCWFLDLLLGKSC